MALLVLIEMQEETMHATNKPEPSKLETAMLNPLLDVPPAAESEANTSGAVLLKER